VYRGTKFIEKIICHGTVKLLTERGAKPIFYLRVGKLIRLAQKILPVNRFVTQREIGKVPNERRVTNLINGEKHSYHDKLNFLQRA